MLRGVVYVIDTPKSSLNTPAEQRLSQTAIVALSNWSKQNNSILSFSPISLCSGINESIELFCYDQSDRPVIAEWSKRCSAGVLSNDFGVSCIYTTPRTMTGIQEIYAEYEELEAMAKVKGIK